MPRNRFRLPFAVVALGVAAITVSGCGGRREAVFVDLSRVQSNGPAAEPVTTSLRTSTDPIPRLELTPSGSPTKTSPDSAAAERLQAARRSIERNRELALRDLQVELFRAYSRDIERYRAIQEAVLAGSQRSAFDDAYAAVSSAFEGYSAQRGGKLRRLALLIGFPFPAAFPQPNPAVFWSEKRIAEASLLRKQIDELDASFLMKADSLLGAAGQRVADLRTGLELDIVQRQDEMLQRARMEAETALKEGGGRIEVRLADARPPGLETPRVPTITIAGVEGIEAAKAWNPVSGAPAFAESSLRHDLRLWAELRGYRLVAAGQNGRDATKEFVAWISTRRLGP